VDRHFGRRSEPEFDPVALDCKHGDRDLAADNDLLTPLPAEHEHGFILLTSTYIRYA